MSIQTTIATAASTLPPSLARIARAISDNPATVIDSTITDLAAACETSVASVVRFCRAIGLSGYAALRMALASELGKESAQFPAQIGFGAEIAAEDSLRGSTAKIASLEMLAIEETIARLDHDTLEAAAAAIESADRVLLFGIGASSLAAADLSPKLLRIGVTAISISDPHEAVATAALSTASTVAIGFSHSGTTAEAVRFLQTARSAGATTVALTGSATTGLAGAADHVLLAHARESRFRAGAMVSRIAQLALVDCVFIAVAQLRRETAVAALERTAEAARRLRAE